MFKHAHLKRSRFQKLSKAFKTSENMLRTIECIQKQRRKQIQTDIKTYPAAA